MATTITVGRATITAPQSQSRNGAGTLALSGMSAYATTAEADAAKQQLLGHRGDTVPVLADAYDSELTGFYTMAGASVREMKGFTGFAYTVTLAQLAGGFAAASIEEVATLGVQPGAPASNVTYYADRPDDAYSASVEPTFAAGSGSFECEDGDLSAYDTLNSGDPIQYQGPPGSFYAGCPRVETYDGTSWNVAVGNQIPATGMSAVRISNGLVRMSFQPSATANLSTVTMQRWLGSSWGDGHEWTVDAGGAPNTVTVKDVPPKVVRNDRSSVAIIVQTVYSNDGDLRAQPWSVSLRRGHKAVTMMTLNDTGDIRLIQSGETNTAEGGSWPDVETQDGTDSDGNKYVLIGPTVSQIAEGALFVGDTYPCSLGVSLAGADAVTIALNAYSGSTGTLRVVT